MEIGIFEEGRSVSAEGPIFAQIGSPMNALQLFFASYSVHTKKLCSRLSSNEVHFFTEGPFYVLSPLWGT